MIQSKLMVSNQEISIGPNKLWGGSAATAKEGCRILATTFLSLLLPLSFLLLARLATARYFFSIADDNLPQLNYNNSFLTSVFLHSKTTIILSLLVSLICVAALAHGLTGGIAAFLVNSQRRRLHAALVLLFMIQVCLCLGVQGSVDIEINSYTAGSLVLPRRLVLVLGLHEIMVFWWRSVVNPVVDEVFGLSGHDCNWMEKVAVAVAFGNLWWRRLREEAEALVVLPQVMAELKMDVEVADVLGWWLYYLTAAEGVVSAVKGFTWFVRWIFRHRPVKKVDNR